MPLSKKAGFPTYWTTFGHGPRAALLIHCALEHSGSWQRLARFLSNALTMTAFDMPGHGRSARWDGRAEIQGATAAIAAEFLEGPADIIGHSFGATVALRLAVMRPSLVRTLTLIEPVFFAVALQDRPDMRVAHGVEVAEFTNAMQAGDARAAARAFTALWGGGVPWEALPEAQKQLLADQMYLIEAGTSALYDDAGGMLVPGALDRIRAPVLLIEGSTSPSIIAAIHEGLAARLPSATRAIVPDAAHMAPITHPRQVATQILRFLKAHP